MGGKMERFNVKGARDRKDEGVVCGVPKLDCPIHLLIGGHQRSLSGHRHLREENFLRPLAD